MRPINPLTKWAKSHSCWEHNDYFHNVINDHCSTYAMKEITQENQHTNFFTALIGFEPVTTGRPLQHFYKLSNGFTAFESRLTVVGPPSFHSCK